MAQRYTVAILRRGPEAPPQEDGYTDNDALQAHPRFKVTGAAEVPSARPAARGFPELDHLLEDLRPDVLALQEDLGLDPAAVDAAAGAGVRGIVCEHPGIRSTERLSHVLRVAHETGLKILIPHVRRCLPAFRYAKSRYLDGSVGKPMMLMTGLRDVPADRGVSWVDVIRFLHDDEHVAWVFGHREVAEDDGRSVIYFGFESGARALVDVGTSMPGSDALVLVGTKGTVRVRQGHVVVVEASERSRKRNFSGDPESQRLRCWYHILSQFSEWLDGAQEPELGLHNMAKSIELTLAAQHSALRAERVSLPFDPDAKNASSERAFLHDRNS